MKQELLQILLKQLTQNIIELNTYIESERAGALQAPSRMESRYDSEKQEASYRANKLMERKAFIEQSIKAITEYIPHLSPTNTNIGLGSFVVVSDEQNNKKNYFILPAGEGEIIEREDVSHHIFILSPSSPLFSMLERKRIGDTYTFRDKIFTVQEIQ